MLKTLCLFLSLFSLLTFGDAKEKKVLLALGDSLTEGYGVRPEFSYPSLLQEKLNKNKHHYKVINGGVSGSTSASGKSRLKWFLKAKPDVMILALGSNDGLRGLKVEQTKKNLSETIELAKENNVKVILAGMQMPPNYGKEYRENFKKMYSELAKKYELKMIPFLLEGIAGIKKLNIEDGIHPNKKGYEIMVENIYKNIKEYL